MTTALRYAKRGVYRSRATSATITIEPGKRGGKPCIRGLRITLDEHPDLEKADFPAVYRFASEAGRKATF